MRGRAARAIIVAILATAVTPSANAVTAGQSIVDGRQFLFHFDSNSSGLEPNESTTVADVAAYVENAKQAGFPIVRIVVVGHTDTVGSKARNLAVSKARALRVADALVSAGISPNLLAVDWQGESQLAVDTGDNVSEPLNRCVTVDPIPGPEAG